MQEGTQNRNDSKAATTSKETLKVSDVYTPREKVAERCAKLAGLHCRLPWGHRFLKEEFLQEAHLLTSGLRTVAILKGENPSESYEHSVSLPHSHADPQRGTSQNDTTADPKHHLSRI